MMCLRGAVLRTTALYILYLLAYIYIYIYIYIMCMYIRLHVL